MDRPRRFYLQYEQEPRRYIAPWPFLLINALLAAGLALAVDRLGDVGSSDWDWSLYWSIVPAGFVTHLLVLVSGALAAVFTRQRVTISAMLTAFAYASAWVLVYVPALSAMAEVRGNNVLKTACVGLVVGSEICHIGYLIASFVRFNYLAGRKAVYFVALTVFLTAAGSVAVISGLAHLAGDRFETDVTAPQTAIEHSFLDRCDGAVIEGSVTVADADVWAWFEWGQTPELGNVSPKRLIKADVVISQELRDLQPNTTYFYRLVISSKYGTKRGLIRSFTTSRCARRPGGVQPP